MTFTLSNAMILPILFATVVSLPALPPPEFADTEVSTNIVLEALGEHEIAYSFRLELAASVSNNVELAFGDTNRIHRIVGWDTGHET